MYGFLVSSEIMLSSRLLFTFLTCVLLTFMHRLSVLVRIPFLALVYSLLVLSEIMLSSRLLFTFLACVLLTYVRLAGGE